MYSAKTLADALQALAISVGSPRNPERRCLYLHSWCDYVQGVLISYACGVARLVCTRHGENVL